jgi:fibronectin type 3 domain-containing protein
MEMEARRAVRSLTFATILVLIQLSSLVTLPEVSSALTPHAPIVIDGNAEFIPANGVTGGNGTPSNPYLIDGWEIDASTSTGVTIMNTDAFFVVKDMYIYGPPSSMYFSFIADNVSDGRVENTTIANAYGGLSLSGVMSFTVNNSTVQPVSYPVEIAYSNDVNIVGSDFLPAYQEGVTVYNSSNITITENEIYVLNGLPNTNKGIYLDHCTYCNIVRNNITLEGGGTAIWLGSEWVPDSSNNLTITSNNITGTVAGYGIWNWLGSNIDISISANNIRNSWFGIACKKSCSGKSVYHNNFISNLFHAGDEDSSFFDNGYPSGGNYWDNYTGVDNCSGPNQDVCPNPDGIGDTPFIIDADSRDRYPLMNPFTPSPPTPPTPPRSLQASDGGCAEISLSWSVPVSDGGATITNYRIYRGNTSGGEVFLVEIGDTLSFDDQGLTGGQTYFYEVSAVNEVGEGNRSNEANATARFCQVPSEPQNLQATPGNGSMDLTWASPLSDGNTSISNYRIYRGNSSGGEAFLVEIGNLTSYTDLGLTGGQTYYYEVSAVNAIGEGNKSSEANATALLIQIPSEPQNLGAASGTDYVELTWGVPLFDGNSSITNYRVYRGMSSGGETFLVQIGNTTSHNDTGLVGGQTYFYQVSAVNGVGESLKSNEANATLPIGTSIPSAPRNLLAVPGDSFVDLSWNPPTSDGNSSILNYRIYRGNSPGGETFLVEIGNTTSHNDTGLVGGQTYYYQVSAVNGIGEGNRSSEAGATTWLLQVPSEPRNLVAASGDSMVDLSWNPPISDGNSSVSNYRIYRGVSSGGEAFLVEIGNLTSYTDLGLTGGQTYYYEVSAVNAIGEGNKSNEANATPSVGTTTPSAPRNLLAVPGDSSVDLSWNPPLTDGNSSILNYRIYRGPSSGGEVFLIEIGNVTNYADSGLVNGQTYYYKVSAVNGIGEGPLSNEASAIPRTSPGPPGALNAELTGVGFEDVTLTWTLSIDDGAGQNSIVSYEIFRNTTFDSTGTGYALLASVPNGTSTYMDILAGESDPNDYFYRICALDKFGNSTCFQTQAGKFNRFLLKGINLVSVPLILSDQSIQAVLQTLAYDKVWTFDAPSQTWRALDLSKPYAGNLDSANCTVGMQVSVTRSSNFTVAGVVPSVTNIQLEVGWNLVGFPSFNSTYTVADLKVATGAIDVEGFDPSSPPYFLRTLLDGDVLQSGMGYWIRVESTTVWTVESS